jgi:PTH1 family peptidyl-tRNA hydrolase
MVLDAMRAGDGAQLGFRMEKKWDAEVAKDGDVVFCKPQTFMNASGSAVRAVMDFYKIDLADVVVVYDDKDLPFGVVRLRSSGSSGGHNGVNSMIERLGTSEFARVRVGIASEEMHGDTADYVLGRFSKEQEAKLQDVVDAAVKALQKVVSEGITKQSHQDIAAV